MQFPAALCVGAVALALAGPLPAETLKATLQLAGTTGKQQTESASPVNRPRDNRRPVLHAQVNENLTAHWTCRSPNGKPASDVLVHFFVVREDRLGQPQVPDLKPARVVVESALTMDFKDQDTARATVNFKADRPGTYLVRIEAQTPDATELTADFAALDLEVK